MNLLIHELWLAKVNQRISVCRFAFKKKEIYIFFLRKCFYFRKTFPLFLKNAYRFSFNNGKSLSKTTDLLYILYHIFFCVYWS